MSIVDPKYRRLHPRLDLLSDPVVITQAWKKAQRYIRRSNWYADMLELDQSSVDLEARVEEWGAAINLGCCTPEPMRLVPAPKSSRWVFHKDQWQPEKPKDPIHLRPLAHLGIREQTMATAAMLCLADCIETAQGDTSVTDYFEARRRRIFSYGNRLYCTFDEDTSGNDGRPLARFGWGNSETYSRYYTDYQRFLARPRAIAENILDQLGEDEEVYIVKLDIASFFDRIHRPTLLQSLKTAFAHHKSAFTLANDTEDSHFWDRLETLFGWDWGVADRSDAMLWKLIKVGIPMGLPQGLVASGFFANAYLLEFDQAVGKRLGCKPTPKNDFPIPGAMLHDYCRYVDDLRLVVSIKHEERDNLEEHLKKSLSQWISDLLEATIVQPFGSSDFHNLEVNEGKTEVASFRLMDGQVGVTSRMSLIQSDLSGPGDMETLQQTTAGLEAMLSLASQFDCVRDGGDDYQPRHPLDQVDTLKAEVRDDTIKRFAASRLRKVLRWRRSMTDLEARGEDGILLRDAIDHEIEMIVRKMIRAWAHDPSLSLVLRYAMDLLPSPELLRLVLDDSLAPLLKKGNPAQKRIVWYLYADLLRAGAVETGMNVATPEMPETADLPGYRAVLITLAVKVLQDRRSPWYTRQQALMLLATWQPALPTPFRTKQSELRHYQTLLQVAQFELPKGRSPLTGERLVCALVFQQLHPNPGRFAVWMVASLERASADERMAMLQLVSFTRPDLMPEVLAILEKKTPAWIGPDSAYLKVPKGMHHQDRPLSDLNGCHVALWNVVTREDNPFRQEILWIKLALGLIGTIRVQADAAEARQRFSLRNIKIEVQDWDRLLRPEHKKDQIKVTFGEGGVSDPRLVEPIWCVPDKRWFYALGRLLRSAITGEEDFTVTPYMGRQDWDGYRGMRNCWYSRRQGFMHDPEGMATEAAPFSRWVSELLMRLLQWPGVEITDHFVKGWDGVQTLDDLEFLLLNRLKYLATLFGHSSRLPIYPIPITHRLRDKGQTLRIALVQTLIPLREDFCEADPSLDNPSIRAKHRRHLASICGLVMKSLEVQQTVPVRKIGKDDEPPANLIVFPELSVHRNDIRILRSLSGKTKAIIVAGLNLRQIPSGAYVNEACWLIPDIRSTGRSWIRRFQGKAHPTDLEKSLGVVSHRPHQFVFEINVGGNRPYRMTSAICYDATDLKLAADLKNVSDLFVIPALNRDVPTFDNMVAALHYHMFQHVVLVNTGQYGGSTVQAPFSERHEKVITHLHGGGQAGVSIFDVDVRDFGPQATLASPPRKKKTPPAGFSRF